MYSAESVDSGLYNLVAIDDRVVICNSDPASFLDLYTDTVR
jgi:hypothetical protein